MNELITKADLFMQDAEGNMIVRPEAMASIRDITKQFKDFEKQYKEFKNMLLEGMEEYGIKKIQSEEAGLTVTYTGPTEQVRIDNDKLWKKFADVAFDCQKVSKVKSSIKITVKDKQ